MKIGSGYYFYQNDHLGTPQKMTTVSGAVVWSAKYSSFGKAEVDPASTVTNNLRFSGQYFDAESGVHYNWNRYYDSRTGRYLKQDPIGLKGGLNLYSYANMNPIKLIDTLGLWSGADAYLVQHFFSGKGGDVDISRWAGDYLNDPQVQTVKKMVENNISIKTKMLAGSLAEGQTTEFSLGGHNELYITSIYSFGMGVHHRYKAKCIATGLTNCCVKSQCTISFSADDQFIDPVDLHQKHGLPEYSPITNLGGTPFWFHLSTSTNFSTVECKN